MNPSTIEEVQRILEVRKPWEKIAAVDEAGNVLPLEDLWHPFRGMTVCRLHNAYLRRRSGIELTREEAAGLSVGQQHAHALGTAQVGQPEEPDTHDQVAKFVYDFMLGDLRSGVLRISPGVSRNPEVAR